ncbi:ABC transporter ATP-binding protein [Shinella sp. M27]|uniref:ABC transporter ATP-binding protein n=1 Tax=Shinella sp. M27 TaxID=3368614 RepID=UPI003BA3B000
MTHRSAKPMEINSISKSYGNFRALDNVSVSVKAGELISILGPSGSGKSTLLMAVAGFIRPEKGSIHFAGEDIVRFPANKRGFGVVFQSYALFPHLDVLSNVMFPLNVRGIAVADSRARAEAALETVKLAGFGDRKISALSGGQRQRVALARAIVFEPNVLLMDEPLSALDKTLREEMQIEIRELHTKLSITTLYVTHDQREAMTIADRVAVMDKGHIVQLDTPEMIYRRPKTEFVARFIGEAVIVRLDEPSNGIISEIGSLGGSGSMLMIRSEDLCLASTGDPAAWLSLSGLLRGIVFQGDSWLLQVALPNGEQILARAQKHFIDAVHALSVGSDVKLHVRRDLLHVL